MKNQNKKKKVLLIICSILLALVIAVSIWSSVKYSDAAYISDEERFTSLAKQFVGTFNNNPQKIESCQRSIRPDLGIVGVLVKYEIDDEHFTTCVFFESDNIFENVYHLSGSRQLGTGTIIAESQCINTHLIGNDLVYFIGGSELPEGVEKFRIEELDYTGYIIDDSTNSHLDILSRLDLVDRDARNYDVELQ